jgi:hypothetical protein
MFRLIDNKPYDRQETFTVTWDGRRPDGTVVEQQVYVYLPAPLTLPSNFIIVRSTPQASLIAGQGSAVQVKTDPYLVNLSYDQKTSLLYGLTAQATVSAYLLPPGITDPASDKAIVLLQNQVQAAGDHTVSWDGLAAGSKRACLISDEGLYTLYMKAVSGGTENTWRASLSLF